MSSFEFLIAEWKDVFAAASKAESTAIADPRTSCFYARRAVELAVAWAYKFDRALKLPYQDNISALIHEPTFKQTAGEAVFSKAKVIVTLGNRAVHSSRDIPQSDAMQAVKELFHFCYWFARLYARGKKPYALLAFNEAALRTTTIPTQTLNQLQRLETQKPCDNGASELHMQTGCLGCGGCSRGIREAGWARGRGGGFRTRSAVPGRGKAAS
jgi:type I restriction enzyme R subunit